MVEIELDGPYQMMYEELCEEFGEEVVRSDMQKVINNALHQSMEQME